MKKLLAVILAICLTVAIAVPAMAYNDVNSNMWYSKAVDFCTTNGYMTGTGNNNFAPNGKVSRAQMAQILYNFAGQPDMSDAENPFSDVKRDAWYANAVLFCKSTNIVSGTSATTYSPNAYVTREQVCKMLMGYYAKSTHTTPSVDLSVLNSYTDKAKISNWAQDSVAWAIQNKIMSGTGNNKLDPRGTCTRAQLAQFICNYYNAFGKIPPIELPDEPDPILPDIPGFPEDDHFEPIPEDWLPVGGYWQGDRKYNMYGIDITDVDGVPMADEIEAMAMINEYRVQNGLSELKWNTHAQLLAEVRACEAAYIYSQMHSNNPIETYTGGHSRPDKSHAWRHIHNIPDANCIACKHLSTNNFCGIEELKATELMIDPDMVANNKTLEYNCDGSAVENLANTTFSQGLASAVVNGWKGSPGHDNALKAGFEGYFAVAESSFNSDQSGHNYVMSYNAYSLNWIDTPEPPLIDPDDGEEWYPGKGIHYDRLGFNVTDIPAEYTDWILRDPEMDLDAYGPTDHDINSVEAWLLDQGLEENSAVMAGVKAHFFNTLSMDEYIKYMISRTDVFHYTNLMADGMFDINYLEDYEIQMIKEQLVENVADKVTYQHRMETSSNADRCDACYKDHADRNLAQAEPIVNQFFMDTYGFDISKY